MSFRIRWWFLLAALLVLSVAVPVWAQKATQTVTPLSGSFTITLSEGWEAADHDGDGLLFAYGDASMLVFDPETINTLVNAAERGTILRTLVNVYAALYGERLVTGDIQEEEFAGFDAAVWYFSQGLRQDGAFVVVKLGEDRFAALDIVAPTRDFDEVLGQVELMAASLSDGTVAPGTAMGQLEPAEGGGSQTTAAEPCTVSVATRDTARLRVGPGFNRTSVAFLPSSQDFAVIGRAFAEDGSEWYKLDKEEAAPQTAASEVWVLAGEVDALGGCADVEIVAASAVIPITAPEPTRAVTGR